MSKSTENFVFAVSKKRMEKPFSSPKVAIKNCGTVRINNSFFRSIKVSPNNHIQLQFDAAIGFVRFRFVTPDTEKAIEIVNGSFTMPKTDAVNLLWVANRIAWGDPHRADNASCDFTIVRSDDEGWYYAKASGYRSEINHPIGLKGRSIETNKLWELPNNFYPEKTWND